MKKILFAVLFAGMAFVFSGMWMAPIFTGCRTDDAGHRVADCATIVAAERAVVKHGLPSVLKKNPTLRDDFALGANVVATLTASGQPDPKLIEESLASLALSPEVINAIGAGLDVAAPLAAGYVTNATGHVPCLTQALTVLAESIREITSGTFNAPSAKGADQASLDADRAAKIALVRRGIIPD